MEILLWLVPPVVVTLIAMGWVSWLGREGRGEVDPEVAATRLARALDREFSPRYAAPPAPAREGSPGVAVRPWRPAGASAPGSDRTRRAS